MFIVHNGTQWYLPRDIGYNLKQKGLIKHIVEDMYCSTASILHYDVVKAILKELSLKSKHRVYIDGKWYRLRRGKIVEIPSKWVDVVTYKQTIIKRKSKEGGKRFRKNNIKK